MSKLLFFLLPFILASRCINAQTTENNEQAPVKITPVSLVEQQVSAYNARHIDAFLAPYADSVELYTFPDKLISKGKEVIRQCYSDFFNKTPDLHCEIRGRLTQGNNVIDKESITGIEKEPFEGIAIY